jgi:FkbM family methyltransferase
MTLTSCFKKMVLHVLAQCGWELQHQTSDPILLELDEARKILRLNPNQPTLWQDTLSHLALSSQLRNLLLLHKPDLIIDIGANRGQFATQMRQLSYQGPILSLEPQHALATELQARARSSSLPWTVLHGAAGDSSAELTLNSFVCDVFSSFHTPNSAAQSRFPDLLVPAPPEKVNVRPIDDWLNETPYASAQRILFKTDTQGHDMAVLAGASATLQKTVIVLTEASLIPYYDVVAKPEDVEALLAPLGFRSSGLFSISHENTDLATIEVDCLYTRYAKPNLSSDLKSKCP